jgi:hypothetical protein
VLELDDVVDPVLFFRVFDMLTEVKAELGGRELDPAARSRAATLLRDAESRLRAALSPSLVDEFQRVVPALTDQPTTVELRLAYGGTLAWLYGIAWMTIVPPDEHGDEVPQGVPVEARTATGRIESAG